MPKIKIGYSIQNLDAVPLIIAYQNGYFQDQGIGVELIQAQGRELAVAIGSGQVDMGITSAPHLYGPIEKGVPIKMLSPMSNTPSELFVHPNSSIKSFKDLEGKKVSYGMGHGTKELILRYVLKKENVDTNKINFIPIDNQYFHIALMEQRTIDAAIISDAHYVDVTKKLGVIVLPDWQVKDYNKIPIGLTISANTDFLNSHEENARSFFKAIIEGHRYLKSHLDESAIIVSKFYKDNSNGAMDTKPDDFKNLVNEGRVTYALWEDTTSIVEMAHISYEIGMATRVLSLDDMYDLRFKNLLESAQNEIYSPTKN